jgi:RNA polymerase sigma-70 factor, ECF subfamily
MVQRATSRKPTAHPDALEDEELIERIIAGNGSLFEVLMRRHNRRLYCVARSIVRNEDEAKDVMQQAYVNAYVHLPQFAGRARFATWLTRIAVHEALSRVRRYALCAALEEMDEGQLSQPALCSKEATPEEQSLRQELRSALERGLDALPEIYRAVIVMRIVEELSTAEAAECLGISENVVKTRLSRGRAFLRRELRRLSLCGGQRVDRKSTASA